MRNDIRDVLRDHGRLSVDPAELSDDTNLYSVGMTSHASVNLMLALEDRFGVEFPERMLRRRTFETILSIEDAVQELRGDGAATV